MSGALTRYTNNSSGIHTGTINVYNSSQGSSATTSATYGGNYQSSGHNIYIAGNGGSLQVIQPTTPLSLSRQVRVKLGDQFYDTVGELLEIDSGIELTIKLPDEACIFIKKDGSYVINDKHANVIRKGNKALEFNRYLNSADLLEEFIKDLGICGVKQDQILEIPIELFINWLIIRAAEKDGEAPPSDIPRLETQVKYKAPHCKSCGRFISSKNKSLDFLFCDAKHSKKYAQKHGID